MAIEEFGQSLLAGQRQRQRRVAKEQRRAQREIALGSIGGAIAKNYLQEAANNFLQSEPIRAEKIAFKNAVANADIFKRTQDAIDNSGQSAIDYFASVNRAQFEQLAREELEKRGEFEKIGEAGAYNSLITQQVREFAAQQAEAQERGYQLASSLASNEDFESLVALNAKSARPQNLADAAISFVKRKISGRSKEEIDKEAYDAIVNSDIMQNADRLNLFIDKFRETKNLVGAYDYSTFVVPDLKDDEKYFTSSEQNITATGGILLISTKTTKTNRNRPELSDTIAKLDKIDFTTLKDPTKVEEEAVEALKRSFDFAKDTYSQLESPGFAEFQKQLKEETGVISTNITTVADYKKASDFYASFLQNNPQFVKDPVKDQLTISLFDTLGENAFAIEGMIAQLQEEGVEKQELLNALVAKIANTLNEARNISLQTRSGLDYKQ